MTLQAQPVTPSTVSASCSLFAASARLQEVIAQAPAVEPWYADVRTALEECRSAVEHHLHGLLDDGGLKDDIGRSEPRLISRLDRLDAELQGLLPELLDANDCAARTSETFVSPLARLAAEIRQLADEEVDLLYESLLPVGSLD